MFVPVAPLLTALSGVASCAARADVSLSIIGTIRPPQPHGPTWSRVWSTYQSRRESQSEKRTNPFALAGGADGSETTRAAELASTPAATMPPIARVEMRPPPSAAFAGVSMGV